MQESLRQLSPSPYGSKKSMSGSLSAASNTSGRSSSSLTKREPKAKARCKDQGVSEIQVRIKSTKSTYCQSSAADCRQIKINACLHALHPQLPCMFCCNIKEKSNYFIMYFDTLYISISEFSPSINALRISLISGSLGPSFFPSFPSSMTRAEQPHIACSIFRQLLLD